jgi:hypothetical protein
MKTFAMILAVAIAAPAAFVACDRTVETETKVHSSPDKTKVEQKTVTESPSGDVSVTKEKKEVTRP